MGGGEGEAEDRVGGGQGNRVGAQTEVECTCSVAAV